MTNTAASRYVPKPVLSFFSLFPLHTYPPIPPPHKTIITRPTLWILPPRDSDVEQTSLLSSDVECLKWQAYLALRGVKQTALRWDITPDGAIDRHLPNLHIPLENPKEDDGSGDILAAHLIPGWVDAHVGENGELEGYKDEKSKDESRAWVSLLEGDVHNAFVLAQPKPSGWRYLISPTPGSDPVRKDEGASGMLGGVFSFSLSLSTGTRVSLETIESQYRDAIGALSDRLGTDTWFLGSESPTALDALAFAYLHAILHSPESIRVEVIRRANLVAWEMRVRALVQNAFEAQTKENID